MNLLSGVRQLKFRLLTTKETAEFLGVSIRTFWNLKERGLPVLSVSVSNKRNSYRVSLPDLIAWCKYKKRYAQLETREKIEVDIHTKFYANP